MKTQNLNIVHSVVATLAVVISIASIVYTPNARAQSIQDVQMDLLSRAESYCSDSHKKGTKDFNACVNSAYELGWNRYKEAVQLQIAQQRAVLEQQQAKERRQAEGWAQIQQAAKMLEPVRVGTTCNSRQMVAGTWTTQCF